jgi:hypothetical protein
MLHNVQIFKFNGSFCRRERITCFLTELTEADKVPSLYYVYFYFSYALFSNYCITSNLRCNFPAFFRTQNYRSVLNSRHYFQLFENFHNIIFLTEEAASLKQQYMLRTVKKQLLAKLFPPDYSF